jgi:hypothetical protein
MHAWHGTEKVTGLATEFVSVLVIVTVPDTVEVPD